MRLWNIATEQLKFGKKLLGVHIRIWAMAIRVWDAYTKALRTTLRPWNAIKMRWISLLGGMDRIIIKSIAGRMILRQLKRN